MSNNNKIVQISHGGGGLLQTELIKFITEKIPIKQIKNGIGVNSYDDGATIPLDNYDYEIVITADGHTISPIFFPGGNLGKLAACGTINDLIMMGAKPMAMTSVIIIEEGTTFDDLERIVKSFNSTTKLAGVAILGGDTKVMPRGTLKGIIMSTSGIGIKPKNKFIADSNCQIGSKIILTGSIGDHGTALMASREGIKLETTLKSDITPLLPLIEIVQDTLCILAMKDPTRGGLASALNEWASKSNVGIQIEEDTLVIKKEVQAIADILGLDPLEISNEGKAIICVLSEHAEECLEKIKKTSIGKDAAIIGEIIDTNPGMVVLKTFLGGTRILEMPMGEPIPRVC